MYQSKCTLADLAEEFNQKPDIVYNRLFTYGWDLEKALTASTQEMKHRGKKYEMNGVYKTLKQWADEYGIGLTVLNNRISTLNWDIHTALHTPVRNKKSNHS